MSKLNALIIDLDYYTIPEYRELKSFQIIELLKMDIYYLEPSFYIDSGRGLYLIWLLEDTYATQKSKKFWKQIEKTLIQIFSEFGADKKVSDVARVLRLVGSKNSKTGEIVKIIQPKSDYNRDKFDIRRYELHEMADFVWGIRDIYEKNKKVKKGKQIKKVIQLKNTYTLNYSRCRDLEKLVELRINKKEEGWRENLLFLYRLNLLYCGLEAKTALDMTLSLNKKFGIPLEMEEVINATENAEGIASVYHRLKENYKDTYNTNLNQYLYNGGAYIYSNKTIIEELKISEEEQAHLLTIIDANEKKNRRYKRNKIYYEENKNFILKKEKVTYNENLKIKGKLTREEKNEIKRAEIKDLLSKGLTQREIAKEINMSLGSVNKHIKKIIKD